MLVLKLFTLLFTINTERIKSLCMKGNCFCTQKGDCLWAWKGNHLCIWKGDPLCPQDQQCWLPLHQLSITSTLIIDLPHRSTEAIAFSHESESWLLILYEAIVDPRINRGDHLFMQKWKFTVDPLWGDCWSLLPTPPPGSTEVIAFSYESESWLFILSEAFINPPRRFADFEQMLGSTSACLASQRTFPFGKSNKPHTVDVIYFTFADFRVAQ